MRKDPTGSSSVDDFERGLQALDALRAVTQGPAPPLLSRGQRIGPFTLVELIGAGGQGEVWRARQASVERTVALKLLAPGVGSATRGERFRREAQAAGRLRHPGIVRIHDHGVDATTGIAWIAMEEIEGGRNLAEWIEEGRRPGRASSARMQECAQIVVQVADAVHAAHQCGVVHRDLKPRNILLDRVGAPLVTDFGLAKLDGRVDLTLTGDAVGTFHYMSPEQVSGRGAVDERSDVFGLGVVLYEMLTALRPFEGDTRHQICDRILSEPHPEPRAVRSTVPRDLAVICGKCLEKEPARRYGSMAELAADLRRWQRSEPISARPPSRVRRVRLWVVRNPYRAAAIAVTALALASVSYLWRSERHRFAQLGRLAALRDLDALEAEAETLWPPHPSSIPRLEDWLARASEQRTRLPELYAERARLRRYAAAVHVAAPESEERARLAGQISWLQRAERSRRSGDSGPHPRVSAPANVDVDLLLKLAERHVGRHRQHFGDEHVGLALADAALASAAHADAPEGAASECHAMLARAHFALGRDGAALAAADRACATAPGEALAQRALERATLQGQVLMVWLPGARARAAQQLATWDAAAAALAVPATRWVFPDDRRTEDWWHANLETLITRLEALAAPNGLLSSARGASSSEHGWSVPRRLAVARRSAALERSRLWQRRWARCSEALATSTSHAGVVLAPIDGLVPIGPDPDSGLQEFWHVASGEEPRRGVDGHIRMGALTGLVLVLLPGGEFAMGVGGLASGARNHDGAPSASVSPEHRVSLAPFLISKYELTQAQWQRLTGQAPSSVRAGTRKGGALINSRHPVESVSAEEVGTVLRRFALGMPSEAQWEYAGRAGTSTTWWYGNDDAGLLEQRFGNVTLQNGDRTLQHTVVGTFPPNPFGLHDVHGNVSELCLDRLDEGYYLSSPYEDPVCTEPAFELQVHRGGSFNQSPQSARCANRAGIEPANRSLEVGVRPALAPLGRVVRE